MASSHSAPLNPDTQNTRGRQLVNFYESDEFAVYRLRPILKFRPALNIVDVWRENDVLLVYKRPSLNEMAADQKTVGRTAENSAHRASFCR